jgi:predicted Zn-dependent peptidase
MSLDARIKLQLNTAIQSFDGFTKPFGEAIIFEQTQIKNSQKAINDLKTILEVELAQLIQEKIMN